MTLADRFRRIALLNPLGDYGLGGYTYELAEGLLEAGVAEVDVYCPGRDETMHFERRHRLCPVLGGSLLRQRGALAGQLPSPEASATSSAGGGAGAGAGAGAPVDAVPGGARGALREWYLPLELAAWLWSRRYDVVWTQWPVMDGYGPRLWAALDALGVRIVHTVHDVRPHEATAGYLELCGRIYRHCHRLVVHSRFARRELELLYPHVRGRVIVAPHGLYTTYRPRPAARPDMRRRLGLERDAVALLCFGGIRPYKNMDGVLHALRHADDPRLVLVVAGRESGYPDLVPGDPVGRTRRLVAELGLEDRVRLLPGPFDPAETEALFAACDVALLPYLESYGSGLLLLCMTLGIHVAATRTGGMDEHLDGYVAHTLLEGPSPGAILAGMREAAARVRAGGAAPGRAPFLEWPVVARHTLRALARGAAAPRVTRFAEIPLEGIGA